MVLRKLILMGAMLLSITGGADAKHHMRRHAPVEHTYSSWDRWDWSRDTHSRSSTERSYHAPNSGVGRGVQAASSGSPVSGIRPANCAGIAWCGCYLRTKVNHDPGPEFNLASNWQHFGSPSNLVPGAIVVYPHHVAKVVEVIDSNTFLADNGNCCRDGMAHILHMNLHMLGGVIAIRSE